jgi:Uma2 family endonuclease
MSVTIPIKTIELAPGSHIRIHNLSWLDFEGILAELENERNTRASYYQQVLELVSPLALHEPPIELLPILSKRFWRFREAIRVPEIWIYNNDHICFIC